MIRETCATATLTDETRPVAEPGATQASAAARRPLVPGTEAHSICVARVAARPERFDVIVAPNLYGDILSDVAAEVSGSVGMAEAADIGAGCAVFEAVHGSTPDIAGLDVANPSGLLLASVKMLAHIGQGDAAERVHNAWLRTIEDGVHTVYMYFDDRSTRLVGTTGFADAVARRIGDRPSKRHAGSPRTRVHRHRRTSSPSPGPAESSRPRRPDARRWRRHDPFPRGPARAGPRIVFGFDLLAALGQVFTETSKAAIIAFTMPALTAVLATFLLGERLRTRIVASLVIGMAGLGILASEDLGRLVAAPLGPAIMLLSALSWALGNVALKARRWNLSPLALTIWFFVVSSALCWPLVFVFEPPWQQSWPTTSVLRTLAFHVLGPMVICYAIWTELVGKLPATVAAIATLATPVVGVSSAIIFLDDPLTWQKVVSLSMILISILITLRTPVSVPGRKPCSTGD